MKTVVASPRNVFMDFVTENKEWLSGDFDCFQSNYFTTIGTDFYMRPIELDEGKTVKAQIWHLSEQERFSTVRIRYYKGTSAAIFVYSDLEEKTLVRIGELVKESPLISAKTKISLSLVFNKKNEEKSYNENEIISTGKRILEENLSEEIAFSEFYILDSTSPWEQQKQKITKIMHDLAYQYVKRQLSLT